MCACCQESQPYPGLHQKKHCQQVKGGDSAPLVRSRETPLGLLCLEPPEEERQVGEGPEEGHKDDQMAGTLVL